MPNHLTIDHLELTRSLEYVEVMADQLAALSKGSVGEMTVVHEADDSCCRRELWVVSLSHLLQAVSERRGKASVVVGL